MNAWLAGLGIVSTPSLLSGALGRGGGTRKGLFTEDTEGKCHASRPPMSEIIQWIEIRVAGTHSEVQPRAEQTRGQGFYLKTHPLTQFTTEPIEIWGVCQHLNGTLLAYSSSGQDWAYIFQGLCPLQSRVETR